MKKLVLGIILSLSVTFLIGISNVSAEEHDFSKWIDVSEFTLPNNISSDDNYIVIWKRQGINNYRMVYWPKSNDTIVPRNISNPLNGVFPYNLSLVIFRYGSYYSMSFYDTPSLSNLRFNNSPVGSGSSFSTDYLVYSNIDIYYGTGNSQTSLYFSTDWLVTTNILLSYEKIADNKGIITADYRHYVDELVDFDSTLLDSSVCMLDYYISYVDFAGVEHNLCDVGTNSLLIPIEVYYNGTYTFYIKKYSDDSILDTATIEVDDLLSISNDYTRYDIINTDSSSDHQFGVFVSQFQYDTDYTIYISPNYKHTINAIYYLDSNGDMVYSESNFSYNLASNGFYYFTFNNHDTNIKTIYFNVDVYRTEASTLFLLINSSLYVDIIDLSDDNNYDCTNLPGWSDSVNNVTRCNVIYNTSSGGSNISTSVNTKTIDDSVDDPFSTDGNRDNTDNFTITFRNMFLQFSKPFYVIGNAYTNFMQVIPLQMMYVIYLGFGLTMLAIFIKIWL